MKYIDLDSCEVVGEKIVCDYKKPALEQDPTTVIGLGKVTKKDDEFVVEAPPYTAHDVGISIPLGPLPGAPSVEFAIGVGFPFTIFPIPTRWVDRMGQSWLPSPLSGGEEDKFQGIPDVKAVQPDELVRDVTYPKR
jgi:hypothetical protein